LEKATELDAENDKDEVVQNTIEAFANLFKANTAVRLVKENLQEAMQRARDFENLEKNGLLPRNDLLKAQLQASTAELNLLDAENNLQLANVNMDLMLGFPTTTDLSLDTSNIERKNDARTLEDFVNLAVKSRKDVAALDYRVKSAEAGVKIARSEKYPSLQLTGGYVAADIPKFLSVTNALNIGVGVSYNISSLWKTKAKIQQAQARVTELETTASMMDDAVRLQINKSYLSLLSNRKKIEVYAKAMEQASENYRIVKNKFDNGLATATELLDADTAKLQATMSYTLAKADAFVAYNKLLQASGTLTEDLKK
jgi:outer membrane protein